ncbi:hypothetical protein JJB07_01450 [Tumebacillus sp. ITR2]|uniref:Nucleotidyltransferase family protein n=1 Tax=Tumebacillus amylolyticus TaxID=2801339 RepID=A0ABS1J4V2_9BACL|nr:hypothetical protein [Tumebacillus amylolyticus]MBL0385298.1 hypothetical protein [Tumebacillus amylolyticus]
MELVIEKVARLLNRAGVTWAAGASWMLKQYGIVQTARDFDVLVALPDFPKVHEELLKLGYGRPGETKNPYLTKHFTTYEIDGVDLDVMAGFTISHEAGAHEFPFDAAHVTGRVQVGEQEVPLSAPEDWLVLYLLMGPDREPKVQALEAYFREKGIAHPQLLSQALEQDLPESIRARVNALFSACQAF